LQLVVDQGWEVFRVFLKLPQQMQLVSCHALVMFWVDVGAHTWTCTDMLTQYVNAFYIMCSLLAINPPGACL